MSGFDPMSFVQVLCDICLVGAVAGCGFTLIECFFILRVSGGRAKPPSVQPPVTLLKPLRDAEPGLAARLAQFCKQDYAGPVQLVFGVQDGTAPAAAAALELKAAFPDKDIAVVVDGRIHGSNRKVSNLINMLPHARYETLVLSDSDIVVGPRYLSGIAALLASPQAGAATCLYYGIGKGLWARLSALAINTVFLPQAITASRLGREQHCCGATIALRRQMLDRIGGFAAFADVLADDHAIGAAVRAAGYDVLTAPFLVGHDCFEASLRQFVLHQIRVARTIKSIEPLGYAGTIVTHPLPLAVFGALSGGVGAAIIVAAALISRVTLCRCVEWRFKLPRQSFWLIPLHDVVAFFVYVASFFGAGVNWSGSDYRVAADGTLIERNT